MLKTLALPPIRRLWPSRHRSRAEPEKAKPEKAEPARANPQSPFWHYYTTFDALAVIRSHGARDLKASAQHVTNYLGVRIDPKFIPHLLEPMRGTVEPIPIPANWHADIAEWAGALRAVDLATDTFTVIELGCGWGCWLNNTGVAARHRGLVPTLIGIEGDRDYIQFAYESCAENGFPQQCITLHHGIAAAQDGVALFPRQDVPGSHWGLSPLFNATDDERVRAKRDGTHDELRMIPLASMLKSRADLLHIDIQGGEADLVEAAIDAISASVAYLLIGTHSRQIEGRLFATMLAAGWRLEIERSAIFTTQGHLPIVAVDGVQGWRNPRLLP